MKKIITCLLAVVLTFSLICPAFALSKGDALDLLVLGDSISHGTGLYAGEKPYGQLLAEHFGGTYKNIAVDGYECPDVMESIGDTENAVGDYNCYALSVGSNDYIEYLVGTVLGLEYDGNFSVTDFGYNDMTDVFMDILITHETPMTDRLVGFLDADDCQKEGWKYAFCNVLKASTANIVDALHEANPTAPILLLNYYDPVEPYKVLVTVAVDELETICANMEKAETTLKAFSRRNCYSAYLMKQVEKTWEAMEDEFWRLLPVMQEMGVDITDIIPGLDTLDMSAIAEMMQDTDTKELLLQLRDTLKAFKKLIEFTDDVMVKMNSDLAALAWEKDYVYVMDARAVDDCAVNISYIDHFHPSQLGHNIIAKSAISNVEKAYNTVIVDVNTSATNVPETESETSPLQEIEEACTAAKSLVPTFTVPPYSHIYEAKAMADKVTKAVFSTLSRFF